MVKLTLFIPTSVTQTSLYLETQMLVTNNQCRYSVRCSDIYTFADDNLNNEIQSSFLAHLHLLMMII